MRLRIALFLIALLVPFVVLADPGVGTWIDKDGKTRSVIASPGLTLTYSFTALVNTTVFTLRTPFADVCFIAANGQTGGAGRVTVFRVIDVGSPITDDAIQVPAIPFDGSDCVILVNGTYWAEPTATDAAGSTLVITGRSG